MSDRILFGTQLDYAWDAWQRAFGPQPVRARFDAWWTNVALTKPWSTLYALMYAAWLAGANDRNGTGFDSWWQEILDKQPVEK